MFQIESCEKQQVEIDYLSDMSEERASAQIRIEKHSDFRIVQMAARKSLETMSGVLLNRSQPKFAVKSVANEMLCLKAMYCPALTGRASILDLKIF